MGGGGMRTNNPDISQQGVRTKTPDFQDPASLSRIYVGHSSDDSYSNPPLSDVSGGEISHRANVVNLFYNLDSDSQEESMRHHVAPVHCGHIFSVVVGQLGRNRPEIAPLAEFIKITKKAYCYAKLLKLRVVNKDRLFTIDNLKKSIKNLQDVMLLLDQAYKRMAQFCQNLPPLFEQSNLSDSVDFMLEYFEVQTGQHNSFTDVLYSLLDEACEVLNLKQTGNVIQDDVLQASNNDEGWISKYS